MFVVVSSAFIIITGSFICTLLTSIAVDDQKANTLSLYRITVSYNMHVDSYMPPYCNSGVSSQSRIWCLVKQLMIPFSYAPTLQ